MTIQPTLTAQVQSDPFHKGDRIRKAWELAGYEDGTAFAAAAGIDRGALGRYVRTGNVPRRSTLITIAWHTPVRLEWLETGVGPVLKADATTDPDGGEGAPVTVPYPTRPITRLFPVTGGYQARVNRRHSAMGEKAA